MPQPSLPFQTRKVSIREAEGLPRDSPTSLGWGGLSPHTGPGWPSEQGSACFLYQLLILNIGFGSRIQELEASDLLYLFCLVGSTVKLEEKDSPRGFPACGGARISEAKLQKFRTQSYGIDPYISLFPTHTPSSHTHTPCNVLL